MPPAGCRTFRGAVVNARLRRLASRRRRGVRLLGVAVRGRGGQPLGVGGGQAVVQGRQNQQREGGRGHGTEDQRGGQPGEPRGVDADLAQHFGPVAQQLVEKESQIDGELIGAQGKPVDMGGYYHPDEAKVSAAMRPSATLNAIIDAI